MSLQRMAMATFLYIKVFLVLLHCIPFVSAARWRRQKIFKLCLVGLAVAYSNTVFIVLIVILAFRKQVEGTSQATKRYVEDNDTLRKLQESGGQRRVTVRDKNETLKAKVEKLKEELAASKCMLEKAENERLPWEYDRLLDHTRLQAANDSPRDKKE
ncbi:LOW QUALITY PROTEIN: B-cell receptor-associated protein 31-like [Pterocles gutturalis]